MNSMKNVLLATVAFVGINMITASTAEAALNASDCSKLTSAYNLLAKRYGVNNKLVKLAKAYLNKVCPVVTAETRIYECNVLQTVTLAVPLGLDISGLLTVSSNPAQIVCTTQTACNNVASQRFVVQSTAATTRCSAASVDPTIVRLNDVDLQNEINQLP
jgi:hypothetical protein